MYFQENKHFFKFILIIIFVTGNRTKDTIIGVLHSYHLATKEWFFLGKFDELQIGSNNFL